MPTTKATKSKNTDFFNDFKHTNKKLKSVCFNLKHLEGHQESDHLKTRYNKTFDKAGRIERLSGKRIQLALGVNTLLFFGIGSVFDKALPDEVSLVFLMLIYFILASTYFLQKVFLTITLKHNKVVHEELDLLLEESIKLIRQEMDTHSHTLK